MAELRLALCALGAALLLEEERRRGRGLSGQNESSDAENTPNPSREVSPRPRTGTTGADAVYPPREEVTRRRVFHKRRSQSSSPTAKSPRAPPDVKRTRRLWVRAWNRQRPTYGEEDYYSSLGRGGDAAAAVAARAGGLTHFSRTFPAQFDALVELVAPIIHRPNTKFRASISVEERLLVTLHYLATGEGFKRLSHFFHMGNTTVRLFVPETLRAIYTVLRAKYFKCPDTAEEWQEVARGFQSERDFPNCVGALDGRHLNVCAPPETSESSSPKQEASVSLMALVDSKHKFQFVDVACNGRICNSAEFDGCVLVDALETRLARLPGPARLPGSERLAPHCVVADKAFPLKDYLMKPFLNRKPSTEQQIFNHRISHASKASADAFNVLTNRFCILQNTFNLHSSAVKLEDIVMACCALHNFLCVKAKETYLADILNQEGRNDTGNLLQAALPPSTNATAKSKETRDELCAYFVSKAVAVPSQYDIVSE
ncbi:uncharacterized protein [Eucyclogobius newberryi]|uniref:uncharacterized protein n=1 Tax=Eucyclogobius newberryi TaxID=166745 RepID=UPI003B59F86A